ncbi:hypothetical protein ACSBR2_037619 [Camellia fascicularis]
MSGSIQMENVYVPENEVGMWQWPFGKSMTSIVLLITGSSDRFVGIVAPSLARILPIDLAMFGGELLCQVVEDGDYVLAQVLIGNEKRLVHMHLHIVNSDAIVSLNTSFQL